MNTTYENVLYQSAAANAEPSVRAAFIRRTYAHLAGAILLFIAFETLLINSPLAVPIVQTMFGGRWSWAIVLGLFIGVSWLAQWWANSDSSPAMQYLGLGLYIVAEAIVFLPLLFIANLNFPGAILNAGIVTLMLFAALTATVF